MLSTGASFAVKDVVVDGAVEGVEGDGDAVEGEGEPAGTEEVELLRVLKVEAFSKASWFPAASRAPVPTRAVYEVPCAMAAEGWKVIVLPLQEKLPKTAAASLVRRSEKAASAEALSIGSLKLKLTALVVATAVAPSAGLIEATLGASVSSPAQSRKP